MMIYSAALLLYKKSIRNSSTCRYSRLNYPHSKSPPWSPFSPSSPRNWAILAVSGSRPTPKVEIPLTTCAPTRSALYCPVSTQANSQAHAG